MSNLEIETSNAQVEYALGHSSRELDRLSFQGSVLAPYTHQLLIEAGLTAGMHVLDVGSGSGDVSFLAAELVGSSGRVLGVDRSPAGSRESQTRALRQQQMQCRFRSRRSCCNALRQTV